MLIHDSVGRDPESHLLFYLSSERKEYASREVAAAFCDYGGLAERATEERERQGLY